MAGRGAPRAAPAVAADLGKGPARRLLLPSLASVPGLLHAFTVRGSDPDSVLRAIAGGPLPLATLRQIHGADVRIVGPDGAEPGTGKPGGPAAPPEGDALMTRQTGRALGVYVADCLPVLVCDERTRGLAAVHAGWRGTVAGVLTRTIEALREAFGARSADLRIGLGPCIGACCFEVGEEVVEALLQADPGAAHCVQGGPRQRIDLVEANRRQALRCGVPAERIEAMALCTFCQADLLESYRRQRGRAGRMAGLIAWAP